MGLDINLWRILPFKEELVSQHTLFNLDYHSFTTPLEVYKHSFVYEEDVFDFSSIPNGTKGVFEFIEVEDGFNTIYRTKDSDILLKTVKQKGIFILAERVVSLRKGANPDFYNEGIWDNFHPICSKELLILHWDKYFSGQPGDKARRLEWRNTSEFLNYTNEELRNRFKEVVDNFIDKETFVTYG